MKFLYLILGVIFSFIVTIKWVEPLQENGEATLIEIQSLQSCYFSAIKLSKVSPEQADIFCKEHSSKVKENYIDIAKQMNTITDKVHEPREYYLRIWNKYLNEGKDQ